MSFISISQRNKYGKLGIREKLAFLWKKRTILKLFFYICADNHTITNLNKA